MLKAGVFDSGVGGLTVLKDCVRLMPGVRFYYFGDNLNAPYGSRPEEEIVRLVRSALERFRALGVDAALLACNTATSVCAEIMRREFPFPVVGMEPAVAPAARRAKNVLVLCTPVTAAGKRLSALIARFPQTKFTVFPAGGLAGAIECALIEGTSFDLSAEIPPPGAFRRENPEKKLSTSVPPFDGVVLGCTHYLFFRRKIAEFYRAPVFDGNEGTAKRLKNLLCEGNFVHENPTISDKGLGANRPVFLGDCAEINEKIYNSNKCFRNFL